jgi:GNAT superfamily N-acetyltransferase
VIRVREVEKARYTVRAARVEDLPLVSYIGCAAAQLFLGTEHPEIAAEPPTTIAELARWLERGEIFVAVDELGRTVGFAIACELDGGGYLHELDVHPDHGRRGVGRLLVELVRSWAERRGYNRLALSTFVDVPWNAPYYRRLGFRELLPEHLGADLLDARRMEKAAGLDVARRVFMVLPLGSST